MQPTVFAEVDNDWRIAREEIFGPVMVAIPWDDRGDVIRMANDSHYGLAAYVWTHDIGTALTTAHAIESGWIQINQGLGQFPGQSYGGFKQSGIGREYSLEGMIDSFHAAQERDRQPSLLKLPGEAGLVICQVRGSNQLSTTLYRFTPVAAQNPSPHPPTGSNTIPSIRPGVTTVGMNAPRFQRCPLGGEVVTARKSTPSTTKNPPARSLTNAVVPHCPPLAPPYLFC